MTFRLMQDQARQAGLTKIYCACGCIVGLDRGTVATKKKLNKKPECPACRNARISADIDEINGIFEGIGEDMSFC